MRAIIYINLRVITIQVDLTKILRRRACRNESVESWVKNDHLGFDIHYIHNGVHHKYRPDYIIRLIDGTHLILEIKGQPTQQDRSKELAIQEWVQAINTDAHFGKWNFAMLTHPKDTPYIIEKALNEVSTL